MLTLDKCRGSGLVCLELESSKRLRDDRLALLMPLAPSLQRLSLRQCVQLTPRGGRHLSALTTLTSLDLTGALHASWL